MRADHQRLGQAGHADEQAVAAGEDRGQNCSMTSAWPTTTRPQLLDHLGASLGELREVFADAIVGHGG